MYCFGMYMHILHVLTTLELLTCSGDRQFSVVKIFQHEVSDIMHEIPLR